MKPQKVQDAIFGPSHRLAIAHRHTIGLSELRARVGDQQRPQVRPKLVAQRCPAQSWVVSNAELPPVPATTRLSLCVGCVSLYTVSGQYRGTAY